MSAAPPPPPSAPVPITPIGGAERRNRRTLVMLLCAGGGLALLIFAFLLAYLNHRPALKQKAATVGTTVRTQASQVPLLNKQLGSQNQGFAAARPAREAVPVAQPPPATPPPAQNVLITPTAAPTIPAAMSASARRVSNHPGGSPTRPASLVRGVVPAYQVIPCKLVGALESGGGVSGGGGNGSQTTTIKALVDDDIRTWDTHEIIIPKGTQCNTIGHFQQGRDRVFVETDFTFILPGKGASRTPLELVLPGVAQDREYDTEVDTWSVTDLSDGIRGDFIKTQNWDEILLFVSKFLSGAAQSIAATSPSSFGQAYSNGATSSATGLPGYTINPAVGGASAVLDQEAARIAARIEADGSFLRVPAHKQFYVLVTRGFSGKDAVPSGQAQALREKHEDDRLRIRDERRARERAADGGTFGGTGSPAVGVYSDPNSLAALISASQAAAANGNNLRRPPNLTAPGPGRNAPGQSSIATGISGTEGDADGVPPLPVP